MNSKQSFVLQTSVVFVLAGSLLANARPGQKADDKPATTAKVEGTWRLTSTKYGNVANFTDIPKAEQTHLKYIIGGRFIWVDYDQKTREIKSSAGGKYALSGESYKEVPEYGLGKDFASIRDKQQSFTVKIKGDKLRQSGILKLGGANATTLKLEEVWERVK